MQSAVWTAFTTRDANLSPFGKICSFRSKLGHYSDLSRSDEILKVWGGEGVAKSRLVRDASALHSPISVWHQSTMRVFWRAYNFWIALAVIWCHTQIGLCRAHAKSLSTDSLLMSLRACITKKKSLAPCMVNVEDQMTNSNSHTILKFERKLKQFSNRT